MLVFKLAFRNVLRHRRRSLLTLLSMSGGYILLTLSLSMSEGSYNDIIDLFTRDHTGHVQVHQSNYLDRPSLYKTINDAEQLMAELDTKAHVVGVAPRIYGPSLAYGKNKSSPANVIGIDPHRESITTTLAEKVKQGGYLSESMSGDGYFSAMIGQTLAQNLKLVPGDELVLISQGADGSIANDIFIISAIVGTAQSHERLNVYLSLGAMRQFLSMGDQVHELAITLSHQSQAQQFAVELNQRWSASGLRVSPWQSVEKTFYNSMQADKEGNYVSMGIIILIVSIGVLNTVLMSTMERSREFGVLKAIGTRPLGVFRLILLESLMLALASCVLGFLIALPINYWFEQVGIPLSQGVDMGGVMFDHLSGEISSLTMGLPALVVVTSTVLVSLIPGVRAARISPLEALNSV